MGGHRMVRCNTVERYGTVLVYTVKRYGYERYEYGTVLCDTVERYGTVLVLVRYRTVRFRYHTARYDTVPKGLLVLSLLGSF
jgi:hypothetical protein